jgi:hypothetical protein
MHIMLERRDSKSLATGEPYDAYNIFYCSDDNRKFLGHVPAAYAPTAEYFYLLEKLEVRWNHDYS